LRERLAQEYSEALHSREQADEEADARKFQQAVELEQTLERRRTELIEAERRASLSQESGGPAPVNGVYRQGPGVVDPRLKKEVQPKYTREAMDAKIQGTVVVEAIIRKDGTIDEARVTKSLDKEHGLDDEALKAASQWLFEPATVKGEAVDYLVTIELSFKLK
jgi:TonB family protein